MIVPRTRLSDIGLLGNERGVGLRCAQVPGPRRAG